MNNYVKNRWVYSLIWLAVLAIIVWVIAGTNDNSENEVMVNQETYTMESSTSESSMRQTEKVQGYYFVRAEKGVVNVYWIDETGEHLHRETNIAYSLLSIEDQELLAEGIKLNNDEELAGFLENYDS